MDHPKLILIVDDEEINRELLEGIVETFGHESVTAGSGAEALAKLSPEPRQRVPDLVLLDAMMPGMDGFEVAKRIRADEKVGQIPIIMVTALTGKSDRLRAVEAEANDFVTKPIDRTELRVRLTSLLRMKEAQDTLLRHQEELREINQELRKKNDLMEADLHLAREIQSAFMPRQYPSFPQAVAAEDSALRFCHRWIPTTTLGGDFFDVLALSDSKAGVFICDVMGHGVRSALVTAMMRALVGERTSVATDPGRFLTRINRNLLAILQQTSTPMFASAFYMVLNAESGELSYANAGHPSPLRARRAAQREDGGTAEWLISNDEDSGPALGMFKEAEYTTSQTTLSPGDLIMLFTDGVFEVEGPEDEYGEERLLAAVRTHLNLPMEPLFDELLADIQEFSGSDEFEDDVCLVGIEMAGTGATK